MLDPLKWGWQVRYLVQWLMKGADREWVRKPAILVMAVALGIAPCRAQGSPDPERAASDPSIRIAVERVHVPFTVTDRWDRFVTDLRQDNFTVYEDGKKVPVDFFTAVSSLPLRVGLLLDTSNSVRMQFKGEKTAAIDFVHSLLKGKTKHKVFLMTFDTTKDVVEDFTNDPNELSEAVRQLKVGGGTALFEAIYFACREKLLRETEPGGLRRVLLVITDGEDDASRYTLEQVVNMARRTEVTIYAISTIAHGQSSPGEKVLEKLTKETGGRVVAPWKKPASAEFGTGYLSQGQIGNTNAIYEIGTGQYGAETAAHLATALARIQKELELQYTIGYHPPNPVADGKFREIKVVSHEKDLAVRARKGYYAHPPL